VINQLHAPAAFPPAKETRYPVGHRAGLDTVAPIKNAFIAPAGNRLVGLLDRGGTGPVKSLCSHREAPGGIRRHDPGVRVADRAAV